MLTDPKHMHCDDREIGGAQEKTRGCDVRQN